MYTTRNQKGQNNKEEKKNSLTKSKWRREEKGTIERISWSALINLIILSNKKYILFSSSLVGV